MGKYRRFTIFMLRLMYSIGLVVFFYFGWQWGYQEVTFFRLGNYFVVAVYAFLVILFMSIYGGFRVGVQRLSGLIYSSALALIFSNFIMYLILCLAARAMLSPWPMLLIMFGQILWVILACWEINHVYFQLHPVREIIAIYKQNTEDEQTIRKMQSIRERYKIAVTLDSDLPLSTIFEAIEPYGSVLIGTMSDDKRRAIFDHCYHTEKRINIIPSVMDIAMNSAQQTQIFDTPVLLCRNQELSPEQMLLKRVIDIAGSLFGLIVASPFMLLAAISIKFQDRGPVLFRQERLTRGGKLFTIYKFRSMNVDAERHKPMLAKKNDARITKVGKIIRALRIDELPQLYNILRGDMSLVGPRPERPVFYKEYSENLPAFDLRLKMKAGLTGHAQIYGRYNTSPRDKLNMDLFYIENFSNLQDIKLILMTIKVLFMKESSEGFSENQYQNQPDIYHITTPQKEGLTK